MGIGGNMGHRNFTYFCNNLILITAYPIKKTIWQ